MTGAEERPRLEVLYELGCAFAARIQLDELLPLVVTKCREVLNAEGTAVLLLDRERNEFHFPYVADDKSEVAGRLLRLRFPADRGIAGAALQSGRALKVDDAQADPRFYRDIDRETGLTTRNLLAAPLNSHQGPVGVIEVVNAIGRPAFSDEDLLFLEALSGGIAVAIENARLYTRVKEAESSLRTEVGALRRDLARETLFGEMIGTGPAMAEVFRLMESAAASTITVLIEGETGTGKELVARGIHRASARACGPFLAVNCAAMPETMLESELFGHRRGAFTGAVRDNPGLFMAAGGGVVFLDEVSDMSLAMQAKLLRVLEQEEVVPLGDSFPRRVDVRVIAATNRDLRQEVSRGSSREDLFYRLAAFPIKLPPLRERREDILVLASRFLTAAAERHHKRITGFEPAALELLRGLDWPGNVRELKNQVERAVALAHDGEVIGLAHLSAAVGQGVVAARAVSPPKAARQVTGIARNPTLNQPAAATKPPEGSLRQARAAFEAQFIAEVLRRHDGNVSHAAQALGLSRVALQKKIKAYGLR